ncbi:MAG: hypothetical protein JJE49_08470 [Peptostreptococcaceae bacterium]|nr:hypothetical protein [Peptostreptococcaceae bacterium]
MNDLGRELTTFEGFNMDFQIKDLSDEVLGKEMALRPVSINPEVITEHFERIEELEMIFRTIYWD